MCQSISQELPDYLAKVDAYCCTYSSLAIHMNTTTAMSARPLQGYIMQPLHVSTGTYPKRTIAFRFCQIQSE